MNRELLINEISSDVGRNCLCRKLRVASRKVTRIYDDAFRECGITPTQFTLMAVALRAQNVSLSKLADILGMERTTLIRNLKPLERNGLIEVSSEGYRRVKSVELSNKGIETLSEALPLWRKAQGRLKQKIGDDVWAQLQSDLAMVCEQI